MPEQSPLYDLMLLLSNEVEDERRAQIVADVLEAIPAGGGTLERHDRWGTRQLTFRIQHQSDAEYHLLQFTGPASLLESLSHTLHITDGVLRFRIIKNLPGTPAAPDVAPAQAIAAVAPEA
jgi:small subunit ribosomal protein S6